MVLAGFALSIVAGVLLVVNAAFWFMIGGGLKVLIPFSIPFTLPLTLPFTLTFLAFLVLGVMAIVFAVVLFIGGAIIYLFKKEPLGGIIVLVAAILSIGVGGGFVFGSLCGILAGILILLKKY